MHIMIPCKAEKEENYSVSADWAVNLTRVMVKFKI